MPVLNDSTKVNAPDYFLATVSIPLAEHGYYVFPVNMVKRLLEDNGMADANMVHNAAPTKLGEMFDADLVLYARIKNWRSLYVLLKTITEVEIHYLLKDAKTGNTIWSHTQKASHQSGGGNSGNPIAALIAAAIEASLAKAFEEQNCIDLTKLANTTALTTYPGYGLPPGPYKIIEEEVK